MKQLQIQLFGRLSVTYQSREVAGLESTKVQELLCYLLLHRNRPHPRTTLASILWGDACTTSNSRKYLRNALWRLRSAMADIPASDGLIVADGDWVELKPVPVLSLDVAPFERADSISRRKLASELTAADAQDIDRAIHVYSGCLLANWNREWCVSARDRFHHHYLAMLDKLAEYQEIHVDHVSALALAERLLESDPAHERTHRRLMRVYLKIGDRTNALRQYRPCVDALRNELGVEPGPKTMAVLARICDGRPTISRLEPVPPSALERYTGPRTAAS
jgi:DNA-binding SARP family transcriptional activator